MRVSRDSLRSLFLFKFSRNDTTRKVQARAEAVIALCDRKPRVPILSSEKSRWRNFAVYSHSFTNLRDFSIGDAVCGKCFQNANFLGLHRFDWRVVFTIMTISHDNGLISKRPKFLAERGVYKLVDCLQLLPNSRVAPRSHLCGN